MSGQDVTALDIYREIVQIDQKLLKHNKNPNASGMTGGDIDRLAEKRNHLIGVLAKIQVDESASTRPKLQLNLWPESWENLFDCIHHAETRIRSQGNFWAAVQALEEQANYHTPERRKRLGILEQEEL